MDPNSSLSEPKTVLQLSSPDVPHQAGAVSLPGLIPHGSSCHSRRDFTCILVPLSLCTYYSFYLEHQSLSFVPSEAYHCVDVSSASLALGVSPQDSGCSCLRSLERLPHPPFLTPAALGVVLHVWASACFRLWVAKSVPAFSCFATRLPATRYMPGTELALET